MSHNRVELKYGILSVAGLMFLGILAVISSEKSSPGSAGQPQAPNERFGTYAFGNSRF